MCLDKYKKVLGWGLQTKPPQQSDIASILSNKTDQLDSSQNKSCFNYFRFTELWLTISHLMIKMSASSKRDTNKNADKINNFSFHIYWKGLQLIEDPDRHSNKYRVIDNKVPKNNNNHNRERTYSVLNWSDNQRGRHTRRSVWKKKKISLSMYMQRNYLFGDWPDSFAIKWGDRYDRLN